MKSIKIILALLMLSSLNTFAQQDPNRAFYRYNMNLVNPAYAGAHDGSEIGVNFRTQWVSVQGAPETQSAFFSTQMKKNVGLGISVINDRTFVESQTAIAADFSYRLKLGTNSDLYLGIKAGATSYNVNTAGLVTFDIMSDPSLSGIDGGFIPTVGAGAYIKGESYFLALSIPNFLTTDRLEQNDGVAKLGQSRTHIYLAAGYDFNISDNLVFKPSTMLQYVQDAPLSLNFTAAFRIKDRIELGGMYRLDEGFGGLFLFNAADWVDLGYAYESAYDSPVQAASQGTHEVFIKLKL
ncbi:type IX secretion system membrane protein PorP/SprF [Maribacter sp. 2308TA10-17]|uniref:PorP/SprF family type IX secretion system membrane protein n=1 Tax=Maribacter sp. 2308TA10-17 TaxID=3386276 RepID=UPI0039BC54F9